MLAALLIAYTSITGCPGHIVPFRQFYAERYYAAPEGTNWVGRGDEVAVDVLHRLADATAGYQDYLVTCGGKG